MDYVQDLLVMAVLEHGQDISFCGSAQDWQSCVTVEAGYVILWYNTKDNSSHIQKMRVDPDVPTPPKPWEPGSGFLESTSIVLERAHKVWKEVSAWLI